MNQFNKVLIATDQEDLSLEIFNFGIILGLNSNVKIRCLNIGNNNTPGTSHLKLNNAKNNCSPENTHDSLEKQVESNAQRLLHLTQQVKSNFPRISLDFETDVIVGHVATTVIDYAEAWGADLIIVGMHNDPNKINYAPISSEIIEKSSCSVLVFPKLYAEQNLDKISVFIDFKLAEITMILDIVESAKSQGTEVTFVHILEAGKDSHEVKNKLNIYHRIFAMEVDKGIVSFQIKTSKMNDVIAKMTVEEGMDLFVVRSQKRYWNMLQFTPEYALEILKVIKVPLMIWKQNSDHKINIVR